MSTSDDVPVFVEAYQGWRAWFIDPLTRPLQLKALWKNDHAWPAMQRTEATCTKRLPWRPWSQDTPVHDPEMIPHLDCTCGVVALPHPEGAIEYLEDWEAFIRRQVDQYRRSHVMSTRYGHWRPLPVFGSVSMWGPAVEHESIRDSVTGIRTRYGYPQELWLPALWWDQRPEVNRQSLAADLEQLYGIPVHPIDDLADIVIAWKAMQGLQS